VGEREREKREMEREIENRVERSCYIFLRWYDGMTVWNGMGGF
jgi:hypothetical protein